jgi:hypothetical protein
MKITLDEVLQAFPGSKVIDDRCFDHVLHAGQFLKCLYGNWERNYPDQFFEIRLIFINSARARFYKAPDDFINHDLTSLLANQQEGEFGIYFGACPRFRKSGKNEDVKSIPALWADMDGNNAKGIFSFKPTPDIIVYSGNGYHAYWLLNKPTQANEISQKTLRMIQRNCGSDNVSDFARVLRLPGSFNLKNLANPKRCKVAYISKELFRAI